MNGEDQSQLPRRARADEALRATRAEIDLDALAHNLEIIRAEVAPARVLAVVKADAYGHGVVPVAHRLAREGIGGFGVALAEEGLELREAGVLAPILVLNGIIGSAHRDVILAGLTPVVYDLGALERFERAAAALEVRFPLHLKVDTGMGRLGVPAADFARFVAQLARFPHIQVEGLMTHLASADHDREQTASQLALFEQAVAELRTARTGPLLLHAANSAGAFRHPESRFDLVRAGVALYGYGGPEGDAAGLRPAMRWRSEVVSIRTIPPGGTVGYDATFVAPRSTRVATIGLGYGDGFPRALSGRPHQSASTPGEATRGGTVLIRGQRCPIIGRVSMDLTGVDVSALPELAIGDEAVVLGGQGDDFLSAEEVAAAAGTISYEILTAVSRRVPRVYSPRIAPLGGRPRGE